MVRTKGFRKVTGFLSILEKNGNGLEQENTDQKENAIP